MKVVSAAPANASMAGKARASARACAHKRAAFTVGYWVQERTSPARFRRSLNAE